MQTLPVALPRLLDITPASSLSFVLDTTGSMGEEINAAKIQARHIVEQRRGGPLEPAHYVLVPFHDPGSQSGQRESEGKESGNSVPVPQAVGLRLPGTIAAAPIAPKGQQVMALPQHPR